MLPEVQAGSSIMPGKVNPVICEAVGQAALRVMALDGLVASAAMSGQLELNAFLPLLADTLLESLTLLDAACQIFRGRCVEASRPTRGLREHVHRSWATVVAMSRPSATTPRGGARQVSVSGRPAPGRARTGASVRPELRRMLSARP
jgi:aspartate ammonia-lyase